MDGWMDGWMDGEEGGGGSEEGRKDFVFIIHR